MSHYCRSPSRHKPLARLWPAFVALVVVAVGCDNVPQEVHQADQARIAELLGRSTELQNQLAAVLATQRLLEIVCVTHGVLLAVCLAVLWRRCRSKGGTLS